MIPIRTYARIENGVVAELLKTNADVTKLYHPELIWVDITGRNEIDERWKYDGANFEAPIRVAEPPTTSLAELEQQVRVLAARLEALQGPH